MYTPLLPGATGRAAVVAVGFHAEGAEIRGGAEDCSPGGKLLGHAVDPGCRSLDSLRSLGMTGRFLPRRQLDQHDVRVLLDPLEHDPLSIARHVEPLQRLAMVERREPPLRSGADVEQPEVLLPKAA